MKILHITPYYKPAYIYGGPIVSISRLTKELSNQNQTITVWTTTANGDKLLDIQANREQNTEGVSVCYFSLVGSPKIFFSPRLLIALFKKIKSFDVVHIHTWWNLTAIFSLFICVLKKKKPLFSPRGMLSPYSFNNSKTSLKSFLLFHVLIGNFLLKKTYLHATATQELLECQTIIPFWKGFVAPNLIKLPKSNTVILTTTKKIFSIIFLSRIHHKKGIEILLESLSKLNFNWQLSVVGEGEPLYIDSLKDIAVKLKIEEAIHWKGWINGEDKYQLLNDADLMVLPSFNENFANTILESLSVGTPVLVSNKVGLSDYVEDNDLGWVTALDCEAIVEALNQAYSQEQKRQHIRTTAPAKVREDFKPEVVVQKYINAYCQIVKQE